MMMEAKMTALNQLMHKNTRYVTDPHQDKDLSIQDHPPRWASENMEYLDAKGYTTCCVNREDVATDLQTSEIRIATIVFNTEFNI